jgi:hypothetical protein
MGLFSRTCFGAISFFSRTCFGAIGFFSRTCFGEKLFELKNPLIPFSGQIN